LEFGSFSGKVERIRDVPEDAKGSLTTKYPVEIVVDPEGRELKLGSSADFAIVTGHEPVIYALLGVQKDDFKKPQKALSQVKVAKPPAADVIVAAPPASDEKSN
jgi:hypothetical protein